MKNIRSLKLNKLSEQELSMRELNCLKGGENCCICECQNFNTALTEGNRNHSSNSSGHGGYGSGSFASWCTAFSYNSWYKS